MNFLIIEISKYIMLAVISLYCIESYWPMFFKHGDKNKGVYIRQYIYMLLFHTLGMTTLYIVTEDMRYLLLWFIETAIIFLFNRFLSIIFDNLSGMVINHMCMLIAIGSVILSRIDFDLGVRQFKIVAISFILFFIVTLFIKKFKYLNNFTAIYGGAGAALLILVLSLGRTVNGSKLSFTVLGLTFQPSEIVKILFVLFIAGLLYENSRLPRVILTTILASVFIGILALSTDLGSALIYYMAFLVVVYVATGKIIYSFIGLFGGMVAAYLGYNMFSHVRIRIAVWLDPWTDINNTGYQLTQSLFAIGTGGWFGSGLGKGMPSSIPFVDQDFIFSAICEELGVIFGMVLLVLCLGVFILFVKIALRTENKYYKLIAIGLAVMYIMQVLLTIGGGTRFIPLTGVTLPLVSSGGSSLMSTVILFAVIEGIVILPKKRANPSAFIDAESLTEEEAEEYELEITVDKKRRISAILICAFNCLLVLGILLNLGRFMIKEKDYAITNAFNTKRLELIAKENYRGDIYSSDGTLIATTTVTASGNEIREYPYDDLYCHTVGYTGFGKSGIENLMNFDLITSDISFKMKVENDNKKVKNQGNSVYITIDSRMQQKAYDLLGVYNGAVIVTEVKTGRIIAMVSKPCFNPNDIAKNWDDLCEDKDAPLFNRVSQGLYPPGSTFKIITALEYIRENENSYQNYSYNCVNHITSDGATINCFKKSTHGKLDLASSLAKSCNSSFANIGLSLNRDEFADTLNELYFNVKLPVDFETSASYCTMSKDMGADAVMQTAIGQYKTTMTPLHLNMITAAIANNGVMLKPYLVDKVVSPEGELLKEFNPFCLSRVMSDKEAAILKELMTGVVENGTASKLKDLDFTVAGKTGSAEFNSSKYDSHAWFTGFAPVEDPEIAITVILEDAGTGGEHSVPIAKQLFILYFSDIAK